MTTLQEESNCQSEELNDVNSMEVDKQPHKSSKTYDIDLGLNFLVNGAVNLVYTGYYNGIGVEVKSHDAVALYQMGCFGKGSTSRSRPNNTNSGIISMLRRRQYLKRNQWFKKYSNNQGSADADKLLQEIKELSYNIRNESNQKDVVDLVSSEDDDNDDIENRNNDIVIVVPNSESEDDDYFANLNPKCCLNKFKQEEKLMLTPQEAFFLTYGLGCLQVHNGSHVISIENCWKLFSDSDPKFDEKYVVYHYFRSKGYIVKPGIKFGGDYVLYKDGPEINHAEYIVVIRFNYNKFDWALVLGRVRVANTTSKQVLITEVIKPNNEDMQLPKDLGKYSVCEVLLDRNIPVTINEDID